MLQGRTNNLSHPALQKLCLKAYYEPNGLAIKYPQYFRQSVPEVAVLLAGTAVSSVLLNSYINLYPLSALLCYLRMGPWYLQFNSVLELGL
jgi:hypothetical protein